MAIGTKIGNSQGVNSINGTSGLQVDADANNAGFTPYRIDGAASTSAPLSAAFTVVSPGFFWVSGSLTTTGTLPLASDHPGGLIVLNTVTTGRASFMLTGTAVPPAQHVFSPNGIGSGGANGTKLTVPNSGSVGLLSSGIHWVPVMASGSLTIA